MVPFGYFKGIIMCNVPITCNNNLKCAIMYIYINLSQEKKKVKRKKEDL